MFSRNLRSFHPEIPPRNWRVRRFLTSPWYEPCKVLRTALDYIRSDASLGPNGKLGLCGMTIHAEFGCCSNNALRFQTALPAFSHLGSLSFPSLRVCHCFLGCPCSDG